MTVRELISVLAGMDPKAKVFSKVTAANKSVQGVQVEPDGKTKTKVILK